MAEFKTIIRGAKWIAIRNKIKQIFFFKYGPFLIIKASKIIYPVNLEIVV